MLARVLNQIHEDLGKPSGVRVDVVASALSNRFEPLIPLAYQRQDGWGDLLGNVEEVYRLRVNLKPIIPEGSRAHEVLRPTLQQETPLLQKTDGGSHLRRKDIDVFCEKRRCRKKVGEWPAQVIDDA